MSGEVYNPAIEFEAKRGRVADLKKWVEEWARAAREETEEE